MPVPHTGVVRRDDAVYNAQSIRQAQYATPCRLPSALRRSGGRRNRWRRLQGFLRAQHRSEGWGRRDEEGGSHLRTQLGRTLALVRVGLEDGPLALALGTDHATHLRTSTPVQSVSPAPTNVIAALAPTLAYTLRLPPDRPAIPVRVCDRLAQQRPPIPCCPPQHHAQVTPGHVAAHPRCKGRRSRRSPTVRKALGPHAPRARWRVAASMHACPPSHITTAKPQPRATLRHRRAHARAARAAPNGDLRSAGAHPPRLRAAALVCANDSAITTLRPPASVLRPPAAVPLPTNPPSIPAHRTRGVRVATLPLRPPCTTLCLLRPPRCRHAAPVLHAATPISARPSASTPAPRARPQLRVNREGREGMGGWSRRPPVHPGAHAQLLVGSTSQKENLETGTALQETGRLKRDGWRSRTVGERPALGRCSTATRQRLEDQTET